MSSIDIQCERHVLSVKNSGNSNEVSSLYLLGTGMIFNMSRDLEDDEFGLRRGLISVKVTPFSSTGIRHRR